MRVPTDAIIPPEKLTKYLLLSRPWDDKSKFLAQVGFSIDDPASLEVALRQTAASFDIFENGSNDYGIFYRVEGELIGPNGGVLQVVLIWLKWKLDGTFHFVTLKPLQKSP